MTENQTLSCIELELAKPVKKSVIWLHGLGADGHDFLPIVHELNLPREPGMRFIFPHAPIMPVTLNNGQKMRAWFDIYTLALTARIDTSGIAKSVSALNQLIEKEMAMGRDTLDIFLAGFSQGATIALTAGLLFQKPLAGIIALSGYLPMADKVVQTASDANRQVPIFLGHGTEDPIVPYILGQETCSALKAAHYPVTFHTYPIPHTVSGQEIHDISEWLQQWSVRDIPAIPGDINQK